MVFLKSIHPAAAAVASIANFVNPGHLDLNEASSVAGVARTIAADVMSYYPGTATAFADVPAPYYWWEVGGMFGSMLDYSHYTKDTTYDKTIATALLAQAGEDHDYMLAKHFGDEGNDDQAFWGFVVMAAAERNFPQPDPSTPSWLQMVENIHASQAARWNTKTCGGGLAWQIFDSNPNGMHYKNSVANGGFFQLSARLARATGDKKYLDWAEKIWDWTAGVGLIDKGFTIYDGVDSNDNCTAVNKVSFSYTQGIFMYGAAVMANTTGDKLWNERTEGILQASQSYFDPFGNTTNIMYEHACEQVNKCNVDMLSFKGYFSRFAYASTQMVPSLLPAVNKLLKPSAAAAAAACTGGPKGTTCGQKWYVGGFDGHTGLGQEMCALETIQGILVADAAPPLKGDAIKVVRDFSPVPSTGSSTSSPAPTAPAPSSTTHVSSAASPPTSAPSRRATFSTVSTLTTSGVSSVSANLRVVLWSGLTGVITWGLI
jgi:mannan endo-1,6-alpha-mannosidase